MKNAPLLANMCKMTAAGFVVLLALMLAACGFQLRGSADLAFKKLYVQGDKLSVSRNLNRFFRINGVQLVGKADDAELLLDLMSENQQKRIQSLSGGGLVKEYELIYLLNLRVREASSSTWRPVQTIRVRRDFSYDDSTLLGKAEEEARLNSDMRNDAIRELQRRLTAIKPASTQE